MLFLWRSAARTEFSSLRYCLAAVWASVIGCHFGAALQAEVRACRDVRSAAGAEDIICEMGTGAGILRIAALRRIPSLPIITSGIACKRADKASQQFAKQPLSLIVVAPLVWIAIWTSSAGS